MNLARRPSELDTLARRPLEGPIISQPGPDKIPAWVTNLAWLMENSIPIGKRWSIGLDGIVGLFPGVGDLAGAFVSGLIVASAAQAGLPRAALGRMMANVAVDTLLGGIPFVGDVFDFAFKANTRNIRIYQEHLAGRRQPVRDWLFTLLVALALLAIVAIPIVVFVYIIRRLMM
jgi:hypothetical protein